LGFEGRRGKDGEVLRLMGFGELGVRIERGLLRWRRRLGKDPEE
jgi:hypothetical protein